ncbi:3-oxoacid CoA-transferase subunit B [Gluconacetobacter liquefaciens]|uniref:3-oxoacid CoA-transferase subunit B n=2 Tax=Gluconacetobacter liquefaciens TaxID=89584 RepID=A0A7W4JLN0_GLULI|nr:3-oxoacid CoA-transferase subunit B [Gluconacetobacter liquefaciens]MBB2187043.1 3-oxoacid CoA-transferase subunit B [Gluconacetobacter liquefaciens]
MTMSICKPLSRRDLAARIARDIPEGWYVNLGIGIPTLIADAIPAGREVILHSENGILGFGPAPAPEAVDPWLINAGKQHVTLNAGGSFFHHADSFAMIRGGHLDLCVLGAFEVAANGDLANWATSAEDSAPAVGGAMDLAVGTPRVWVATEHTTREGAPKLVERCTYPLTAPGVVTRIYTNLAVIDVRHGRFVVTEMIPGLSREALQAQTGVELQFEVPEYA